MDNQQWITLTSVTKQWFAAPSYRLTIETQATEESYASNTPARKAKCVFLLEDQRIAKNPSLSDSPLGWQTVTELVAPVEAGMLRSSYTMTKILREIAKDFISLLPDEYIAKRVTVLMYETLMQLDNIDQ